MNKLRKVWMPWTAEDQFPSEEAFQSWLTKRLRRFDNLRMVLLVVATGCLIAGYILGMRPVMLVTIVPLAFTLLLTLAIERTKAAADHKT